MASVNEKMTAIAAAIRAKTGGTDPLTLDGMAAAIAEIETGDGEYTAEYLSSIIDRSIKNLVIPEGMTKLGYYAFAGCNQLESVQFPDSLTELGDDCFYIAKPANVVDVQLPPNLVTINAAAFYGSRIRVTEIPETVTTIGSTAFRESNCGITEIPASVQTIGENAFTKSGLAALTFKGTPTNIGSSAFNNNASLNTINVPWAEGEVANAPWGATNATINYNYVEG